MFFATKLKKLWLPAIAFLFLLMQIVVFVTKTEPTVNLDIKNKTEVDVPVLMYHDILKSQNRQDIYTITPAQLEADLKFLLKKGYTSITIQDLVDFVEKGKELPEKPVIITFDDGHYNNIYYGEPLLEKYNMKAVMFIVGAYSEKSTLEEEQNPNYSYVNWESIKKMAQGDIWDIQSHSWNLHGTNGVKNRTEEELIEDFMKLNSKLEELTGKTPIAFAYPYGYTNELTEYELKKLGYKVTLCSCSGITTVTIGDSDTLYCMRRLARTNNKSAEEFLNKQQ